MSWLKLPFRYRYWVVLDHYDQKVLVLRRRIGPAFMFGHLLIDGPFDSTEDSVRSMAFWRRQYEPNKATTKKS